MAFFQGTVQRDFRLPIFSTFGPAWATDDWVKIFSILVTIRRVIQMFRNLPGWIMGMLPQRVNLPEVSYCAKSISLGYHTAQSQSPRGIILPRVTLPGVSYCVESLITPGNQQPFLKTFGFCTGLYRGQCHKKYMWIHILQTFCIL